MIINRLAGDSLKELEEQGVWNLRRKQLGILYVQTYFEDQCRSLSDSLQRSLSLAAKSRMLLRKFISCRAPGHVNLLKY